MEKSLNDELIETDYSNNTNKLYIRYNTNISDFSLHTSKSFYKDEIIGYMTGFITLNP